LDDIMPAENNNNEIGTGYKLWPTSSIKERSYAKILTFDTAPFLLL
jgi:hypothetical protein